MIEKITPILYTNNFIENNSNGFRTTEFNTLDHSKKKFLTFGCSHTYGTAVDQYDSWPEQLKEKIEIPQLFNLGQGSASIDYIHRILTPSLEYFQPDYVFVLCPNYLRFEYINDKGIITQSVPRDRNRINFMKTHDEAWCKLNYEKKLNEIKNQCNEKNIPNFYLSLDDLHHIIDHADRWMLAKDKVHFDKNWHRIVSEIFRYKFLSKTFI